MRGKKACLVLDLRAEENMQVVPDVVSVLAAAGWKTDVVLKEYGGETLKLARKAAKEGYDLVMGYGGDGTLNAIMNGVRYAGGKSLVADVPGGTYNVWAGAIEVPHDPVKAALTIVNSEPRKVDLGHVGVEGLTFFNSAGNELSSTKQKKPGQLSKTRQYFLLHVGLGIEAAMLAHISKSLKDKAGSLAFDLAALKALPEQRPFPVEVRVLDDAGNVDKYWQGEVWEVIISKVPLFGGAVNIEPDARVDDGLLNVCVITANNAVKTVEQALSLVLQHKLDKETTQYFRGAHFSIRAPAAIGMHVDGSIVKLEEFLQKAEQEALRQTNDGQRVMVNYRFDIEPGALCMAIPRTYTGPLFEKPSHNPQQVSKANAPVQPKRTRLPRRKRQHNQNLPEQGYRVTVIGVVPDSEEKDTFIIAGGWKKQESGDTEVVAVRVDGDTLTCNTAGEYIVPATVLQLQEGEEIVVEGEKNKRNVIRAHRVTLSR